MHMSPVASCGSFPDTHRSVCLLEFHRLLEKLVEMNEETRGIHVLCCLFKILGAPG